MFCKYCGSNIDDDSSFCNYCGNNQNAKISTSKKEDVKHEILGGAVNLTKDIFSICLNEIINENSPKISTAISEKVGKGVDKALVKTGLREPTLSEKVKGFLKNTSKKFIKKNSKNTMSKGKKSN